MTRAEAIEAAARLNAYLREADKHGQAVVSADDLYAFHAALALPPDPPPTGVAAAVEECARIHKLCRALGDDKGGDAAAECEMAVRELARMENRQCDLVSERDEAEDSAAQWEGIARQLAAALTESLRWHATIGREGLGPDSMDSWRAHMRESRAALALMPPEAKP